MAKKTIPQLQEATSAPSNSFMVIDNGSVTKKISIANLQRSLTSAIRTETLSGEDITTDDKTVLFASPDAPGVMTTNLPPAAQMTGKELKLKNIGTGVVTITPSSSETIDGAATVDLDYLNKAITIVSDGTNWLTFA